MSYVHTVHSSPALGACAVLVTHSRMQAKFVMLTEKEVTALIGMNRQIAVKLGLGDVGTNRSIEQLGEDTSIDEVAESIQQNLAGDR